MNVQTQHIDPWPHALCCRCGARRPSDRELFADGSDNGVTDTAALGAVPTLELRKAHLGAHCAEVQEAQDTLIGAY